jgi:hypothetical protein
MYEAQERHAHYTNRDCEDPGVFEIGQLVWVSTKHLSTGRPTQKLDDKWAGPYKITKVYPRAIAVELPEGSRAFSVFHTSLIKPHQDGLPGQQDINEEDDRRAAGMVPADRHQDADEEAVKEWYYKKILNSRSTRRGLEYKIKWPAPHRPTWEPAANVNDPNIQEFYQENPGKPGSPAWLAGRGRRS